MATDRKFRRVNADFFQFENEGDTIEGMLLDKGVATFPQGDVGKYTIETEDGKHHSFLGSTVIDQAFTLIEPGAYVRVTFTGTTRTNNKMTMKQFDVEVAE
jgi:hypothetical protein